MTILGHKEITAIELKYLGKTHKEISDRINIPKYTIDEWFKERGRLNSYYKNWIIDMDNNRQKQIKENFYFSDTELMILTTNLARKFAKLIIEGIKVPVIRKGKSVLDIHGNPKYAIKEYTPTMKDIYLAWKMQRVIKNQPINIVSKKCPACDSIWGTKFL